MTTDDTKKEDEVLEDVNDRWQCPKCNLYNSIVQWQCFACYTSMTVAFRRPRRPKKKTTKAHHKKQAEDNNNNNNEGANVAKKKPRAIHDDDDDTSAKKPDDDETKVEPTNISPKAAASNDGEEEEEEPVAPPLPSLPIPKVMRALVKPEPGIGYVLVTDFKVPQPGDGELLVRSFATAICGSDAILYNWTKEAEVIAETPFIPGHETAGLVVKRGPKTRGFINVGHRVAIENHFFCGKCFQCNHQRRDICSNMSQFGHGKGTKYGGCAEYFVVPEIYCFRITSNISWTEAALLEPLGVAVNACQNCNLNPNDPLFVIGCGTIGCMVIGVAKSMGVRTIIACDILPFKLEIAQGMGATQVFNSNDCNPQERIKELTDGVGVGRLIECSGNADMLNLSFGCVRKGGCMVLLGLPKKPLHVKNVLTDIIFRSLVIRTIHGRRIFNDWRVAQRLIVRKQICLDSLVSHDGIPLSQYKEGYQALLSGEALKVVFDITK